MTSQPTIPAKPTCQFKKSNSELCKRTVARGEDRCWQHARSWRQRWKSLTRNQTVGFILVVLGLVLTLAFGYESWRQSRFPPIDAARSFSVMIPFDTAPDTVPIPLNTNPDDPMFRTYMELRGLAMNGTVPSAARYSQPPFQWKSDPVKVGEAPAFLGRLLQYYIFQTIDNLQRNTVTVAVGEPAEASAAIEPPDASPYPNDRLFSELAANRFFQPFEYVKSADRLKWELKPVSMPKGTEIRFLTATQKTGAQRDSVQLSRPGYFLVDYSVENFGGTGAGNVPPHFVTAHPDAIMQWAFFVTMHYRISRRADGGFNPDRYSQWAEALYAGLQGKLSQSKQQ
jgi:hypothetical protein